MANQNSIRMIRRLVAGAFISIASTAALAGTSSVLLPGANEMSVGYYGDFGVYSLDLLEKCAAAGDPRCLPSGPYPVQSGPGQISDDLLVYQATSTGENYPSPLTTGTPTGDNAFTPSMGSTPTYEFTASEERDSTTAALLSTTPGFTGDQIGTWEVQLGALASFLGLTDPNKPDANLVFLFDNNQQGAGSNNWMYIWATASILDGAGNLVDGQCYALNLDGSCTTPPVAPGHIGADGKYVLDNVANTNYVGVVTDFCVSKTTGIAYNIGTGTSGPNGNCAKTGGYYISNNLGTSSAEFAAYSTALENYFLANWVAHPEWVLSINAKFANLTDGGETLWIGANVQRQQVPEPAALGLLGLGLLAMLVPFRRRRQS